MNTIVRDLLPFDPDSMGFVWGERERGIYPHFQVRCIVVRGSPPRDPMWETSVNLGLGFLQILFRENRGKISKNPTFVFPERWMSVKEQSEFMMLLSDYSGLVDDLGIVTIVTSCPLIISSFTKEMVRIVDFPKVKVNDDTSWIR